MMSASRTLDPSCAPLADLLALAYLRRVDLDLSLVIGPWLARAASVSWILEEAQALLQSVLARESPCVTDACSYT